MISENIQYTELAYYYDTLMNDVDYDAWTDYLIEILNKFDVKHNDLLEMACGTGNIAIRMAKKGYDVTAFDLSVDMLSVAKHKAVESKADVLFLLQDLKDIKISEKFGVILCLCDSINYLTDYKDLKALFNWVFVHLKENGIFIFDINSSYKLKNIIGNNIFTYDDGDIVYIWENELTDENIVEFYLTFFIKHGELYRRFDEVHTERIYEAEDIVSLLKESGFRNINKYEAFTFNDICDTTERINFVIKK